MRIFQLQISYVTLFCKLRHLGKEQGECVFGIGVPCWEQVKLVTQALLESPPNEVETADLSN